MEVFTSRLRKEVNVVLLHQVVDDNALWFHFWSAVTCHRFVLSPLPLGEGWVRAWHILHTKFPLPKLFQTKTHSEQFKTWCRVGPHPNPLPMGEGTKTKAVTGHRTPKSHLTA